jgi:polyhydroxyalkanoate synthesis regulator phasin
MIDLLHKVFYTGIGFAALTEQKAQEIVADLVKRGEVSAEEGKSLAKEMMERARAQAEDIRRTIGDEIKKVSAKYKWPSRQEVDELKQRIADLEGRLGATHPSGDHE